MKVCIEFECDGAPFEDDFEISVGRALSSCWEKVMRQYRREPASVCTAPEAADKIMDVNGNTIGFVRLFKEE